MGAFFQISASFTAEELEDYLLKRYSNIDYILSMPFKRFYDFLKCSCEKDREDKATQQWLMLYPYMVMKQIKTITLEKYLDEATGRNIDNRPIEEIEKEIEQARQRAERK